jgi:hypothetical protein
MEQKTNEKPKRYFKFGLYFFATIGLIFSLAAIIIFFNTVTAPIYSFHLSEKIMVDYFHSTENTYNKKFNQDKKMGEFCYRLKGGEIDNGKINLTIDQQKIMGALYNNDNVYSANIDPATLNLDFDKNAGVLKWHWYNWLGFGF